MIDVRRIVPFALLVSLLAVCPLTAENDAPAKRALELVDVLGWKSIQSPVLSNDGKWLAYRLVPVEGDGEVVVREVSGDREWRFPLGEVPQAGGGFQGGRSRSDDLAFSEDSAWAAFRTYPTQEETRKARRQRKRAEHKLVLVNLADGEKTEFERLKTFSFSNRNPNWLAVQLQDKAENSGSRSEGDGEGAPDRTDRVIGSDLVLQELSSGRQQNIGNVAHFAFNKPGTHLAWTIDAEGGIGNGIQLRDLQSGVVTVLDSSSDIYRRMAWNEEGSALAVLRGKKDPSAPKNRLYSLFAWHSVQSEEPVLATYDPAADEAFPAKMTISPNRDPQWLKDLSAVSFGIHEVESKDDEETSEAANEGEGGSRPGRGNGSRGSDVEKADLVIWHWLDSRLQPQQQVQANRDRNFSYLALYRVDSGTFVRLADESLRQVDLEPEYSWAVGRDDDRYEREGALDGRRYSDIYRVDLRTGERKLVLQKNRWFFGASPNGQSLLYYDDGHFFSYDLSSERAGNLTEGLPTSFVDVEDDHNVEKPPVRPVGWGRDSASVLLYDDWDVWLVRADGSGGNNLTVNGRKDRVRYSRRFQLDPDEKGIDPSELYFFAYGEWTKQSGLSRFNGSGRGVEMLRWDDAHFGSLLKARDAEVFVFSRSTNQDYDDYYAVTGDWADSSPRLTAANPQQDEFLWSSGVRLVEYTSKKGVRHQGALFLPANYEEGKSYPTIVYIYERLSQNLNRYEAPRTGGFSRSIYNSRGYAVLMPDISYTVNDPGMSAVWCVLPALEAAVKTGIVNPERVGLHGHSWGGYQTAFLITQTRAFSAAIAGAPLTNMISMYSSVYWNTGSANQPIFESSQGRFTGGYWEVPEAYTRNSPVYFAQNVSTPLLLLHNDKDGAVDFNQGVEYYNTLRRLNKPVVMLQYKGENHGLRKPPNRKDYTVRMMEFFDHYLKGEEAPQWLKEGIPHLELPEHLKERAEALEPKKESPPKKKDEGDPGKP